MTTSYTFCLHPQAAQFARAFWQMQGRPSYQSETILPKGVIELIFSFNEPVVIGHSGQTNLTTPRCFINGMSDRPLELGIPEQQAFFGMELHAAAVKKLLRIPAGSFLNSVIDLESINKEWSNLWHQLAEADSFQARVQIATQWFGQKQ